MVYFLHMNCVQLIFLSVVFAALFFGTLVNLFENQLPSFITQVVRYGKFADKKTKSSLTVQVPKSWFRHFYIYSSILATFAFYLCVNNYIYQITPPRWVSTVLDYSMGSYRKPTASATRTFLAILLLLLQCLRRLYDTHFVSVFGRNAKMNFGHYVLGYLHYTASVLTILGGAPNFSIAYPSESSLKWSDFNVTDLFATYLFLWAWWHQYQVTVILANLRKDEKAQHIKSSLSSLGTCAEQIWRSKFASRICPTIHKLVLWCVGTKLMLTRNVVTDSYKIPRGDWFNEISSPHNFAEIIMYSSLTLLLWPNLTWWFIYAWVIVNQVEVAVLSHRWYKEKFEDYPQNRKILFPYMY